MGDDHKWKRRLPTHIYDYNYKVSEGYYKPQAEFMETRHYGNKIPPQHQSYAERFASTPWYGGTKGLPYNESQSAGPLIKLGDRQWRSSSLLREMKELEDEGVPLNLRASRRRKKFEEEEELLGIRNRATRNNSLDDKKNIRSRDFHTQIKHKIQNLDNELMKSTRTALTIDPPSRWNYDLDRPSKYVTRKEETYKSPYSSTVKRTSYYDASSSSKPPLAPLRTRKVSGGGSREDLSAGGFSSISRSSRRGSDVEDDVSLYSNRAPRLREERRHREAQEFNSDVNKMIEKMRIRKVDVDPLVIYSHGRTSRSSSVDRNPHRKESKTSRYVYGIGRI